MIYAWWKEFYKNFTNYHFQSEDSDLCRFSFYTMWLTVPFWLCIAILSINALMGLVGIKL